MNETDEYELFLQTWEPSERLIHACLPQNLNDPLSRKRLIDDSTGSAPVERAMFEQGQKAMAGEEIIARAYDFFQDRHVLWCAAFKDFALSKNVPKQKLDAFVTSFATTWIDGRRRRQDSPEMLAIKASVRDFDKLCHPHFADRFVINLVDDDVAPLFTPTEMAAIFEANSGLIDAFLPDYIDHLGSEGPSSLNDLYVRRGVYMPKVEKIRRELHYLSSYSLTMGPVEQFAQTWTPATKDAGSPSIFSAPLPAIQHRVVAFAPFIDGMDLSQLEFVVAPPVEEMHLKDDGVHGGIHEFSFR